MLYVILISLCCHMHVHVCVNLDSNDYTENSRTNACQCPYNIDIS